MREMLNYFNKEIKIKFSFNTVLKQRIKCISKLIFLLCIKNTN